MKTIAADVDDPIWMIYALGGGMGHLTRALSLARCAAREGVRVRILSNSPFLAAFNGDRLKTLIELDSRIEILRFSHILSRDELVDAIMNELHRCRAGDVLIVDTFPRGIGGELADSLSHIPAFKVFVHRDLNPEYVRQFELVTALANYDLILVPGEDAPLQELAHARTQVWMICDVNEYLPRAAARSQFGLSQEDDSQLVVVVGSGTMAEAGEAAQLACLLQRRLPCSSVVRFVSLDEQALNQAGDLAQSLWPLLATLSGVDLLIGAGGYHTVYEARVTETPLLAIPQHRRYDRQTLRLRLCERVDTLDELIARAIDCSRQRPGSRNPLSQSKQNGALEAYTLIASRLRQSRSR